MSFTRALNRSRRGAIDIPGFSTVFRGVRRRTLIVSAEERPGGQTDVRLRLVTGRAPHRRRNAPEALSVLPLLTPHPQSRVSEDSENAGLLAPPSGASRSGGECGGNRWEQDGAYSFVALESNLDLSAVVAHYAAQLEDAGWSRAGEGADGPQAWTAWAFSDDGQNPWTAAFTALRPPQSPRRYLLNPCADRIPRL